MNIATIRKKARDGSLEVEDLLQAAIERQPGLSEELHRLSVMHSWRAQGLQPDGTRVVPFAKWAEVASAYASEEFAGLREIARNPENIPFVLGLIEEIKTNESVSFVLEISGQNLAKPPQSGALAFRIASAFNLLLSFKHAAPISTTQARNIQDYLFTLYPYAKSEADRAVVLLALRGVGDHEAIRFVESIQGLRDPWADTKESVLRAVRKRVKTNAL